MLTIFSTPKPFIGQAAIIQRNAIKSWTCLHPEVEVILFGDEEGTAEIAQELGLRHEPQVLRNENGMKYVHYFFAKAQELASHSYLCFANCDVILMPELTDVLEQAKQQFSTFLITGRRCNLDVTEVLNFDQPEWEQSFRIFAYRHGKRGHPNGLDYFVFPKGLFADLPPFLVGRFWWDNYMVWRAWLDGHPVIDASEAFVMVHQNHPVSYISKQAHDENEYNRRILMQFFFERGMLDRPYMTLTEFDDFVWWNLWVGTNCATHIATKQGIQRVEKKRQSLILWGQRLGYLYYRLTIRPLVQLAVLTAPLRYPLGLRASKLKNLLNKFKLGL